MLSSLLSFLKYCWCHENTHIVRSVGLPQHCHHHTPSKISTERIARTVHVPETRYIPSTRYNAVTRRIYSTSTPFYTMRPEIRYETKTTFSPAVNIDFYFLNVDTNAGGMILYERSEDKVNELRRKLNALDHGVFQEYIWLGVVRTIPAIGYNNIVDHPGYLMGSLVLMTGIIGIGVMIVCDRYN